MFEIKICRDKMSNIPLVTRELLVSDDILFSCSTLPLMYSSMLILHPILKTSSQFAVGLLAISRIVGNFEKHPAGF